MNSDMFANPPFAREGFVIPTGNSGLQIRASRENDFGKGIE